MIDTRTFVQLSKELPREDYLLLRAKIISKTMTSDTAFDYWKNGKRLPQPLFRKMIAGELRRMGYDVSPETLFPLELYKK